jgi:zinc protease
MAAFVLNHIVGGGGFGSRLTAEIREKRGLAYGVGTYLSTPAQSGLWLGSVATENSRVGQSIELIREAWSKARSDGVSAEELADAKRFLTGSYALRFDNTRRIAGMLLGLQEERLAIDYFDKRNDLVEAVSLDDVRRVAARYLDAEALLFVIVGKPEGVKATRPVPDKAG